MRTEEQIYSDIKKETARAKELNNIQDILQSVKRLVSLLDEYSDIGDVTKIDD
jgi:hypothetical protein